MFVLPALPDTIAIPLEEAGMPGCVAHARTLDALALADWVDRYSTKGTQVAAIAIVRERVKSIDGFQIDEGSGPIPFDPANEWHLRTLPRKAHWAIYEALVTRAGLTEEQEKKSSSLSGSHPAPSGGDSAAAAAMIDGETSTTAAFPTAAVSPA